MEGSSTKFLAELPEGDWAKTPESVKKLVAILVERIAAGERQIAALQEGQEHLQEQVQRNSRNSSQPPSQDASKGLKAKPKKKSVKPRGAQLGHEGNQQELYPPEQCEDIKDYYPAQCCECGQELSGEDAAPQRCQVVEIPPLRPIVIEHRFHALTCSCCGVTTRAYDREIVDGSRYGERLCALVGVLSGEYRQSHRMVVRLLAEIFRPVQFNSKIIRFNRLNYAKSALAMSETLSRWASWLKADFLLVWKAGILTR